MTLDHEGEVNSKGTVHARELRDRTVWYSEIEQLIGTKFRWQSS